MLTKNSKIKTFYTPKQVISVANGYSKSPLKPKLLMEKLLVEKGWNDYFDVIEDFKPFAKEDFKMAHHGSYVDNFFDGTGNCNSNGLTWSQEFANSVRYTNSSLYNAIRQSVVSRGQDICFSPTSGFHHARPAGGSGFCTFSGQVIAALKMYRDYGVSGAFIDLDGHYGNSIEDSRQFCKNLHKAVPCGFNFNPNQRGKRYVIELKNFLKKLKAALAADEIQYVVWCHGADSHIDDQLGGAVNTAEWVECADTFWAWLKETEQELGRLVPVTMSLFGGYRDDDYNSVLELHAADINRALSTYYGVSKMEPVVLPRQRPTNPIVWTKPQPKAVFDYPEQTRDDDFNERRAKRYSSYPADFINEDIYSDVDPTTTKKKEKYFGSDDDLDTGDWDSDQRNWDLKFGTKGKNKRDRLSLDDDSSDFH